MTVLEKKITMSVQNKQKHHTPPPPANTKKPCVLYIQKDCSDSALSAAFF